jgi:hypothetical protein
MSPYRWQGTCILIVLTVAVLSGCGNEVAYMSACTPERNDQTVAVRGYIQDLDQITCSDASGTIECNLSLVRELNEPIGIRILIEQGIIGNRIEKLEKYYRPGDIKINDKSGKRISLADNVVITGVVKAVADPSGCFIRVTQIERR